MMSKDREPRLTCQRCGSTNYSTTLKSRNLVATCSGCGSFIKNIPYAEPEVYAGKYKGKAIKDLQDISYLHYMLRDWKLNPSLRDAVIKQIDTLEYLGK